ncbi:hypothetical protein HanRHA438_Chr03g0112711 [Helianthus annuus]|nr:hypothetical protein HanRHA438_Chr03g0112711 [Helianthus annuus]
MSGGVAVGGKGLVVSREVLSSPEVLLGLSEVVFGVSEASAPARESVGSMTDAKCRWRWMYLRLSNGFRYLEKHDKTTNLVHQLSPVRKQRRGNSIGTHLHTLLFQYAFNRPIR